MLLALGWILRTADWDWRGAEQAFRRSLQLRPDQPDTLAGLAVLLFNIRKKEEAFRLGQEEKPGAVHLEFPEDIAHEQTDSTPFVKSNARRPIADEKCIKATARRIEKARSLGAYSGEAKLLVMAALFMADELHDMELELQAARIEEVALPEADGRGGDAIATQAVPSVRERGVDPVFADATGSSAGVHDRR